MSPRLAWILVPLLGITELCGQLHFSHAAPRQAQWRAARTTLARLRHPGDLVVIAPAWESPMARQAFGETLMPLKDVARSDVTGYQRVIEVSVLGQQAPELRGFRLVSETTNGKFTFRTLSNPNFHRTRFDFVDHVAPNQLEVSVAAGHEAIRRAPCAFSAHAIPETGGLFGPVAYPKQRFLCRGGREFFVGVTIIDDQDYRPRRCIYAHPPDVGSLTLDYHDVPMGRVLHGHAGLSYFLYRDGGPAPVELSAYVDGSLVGHYTHHAARGWVSFDFDTRAFAGQRADVRWVIQSSDARHNNFCFAAVAQ